MNILSRSRTNLGNMTLADVKAKLVSMYDELAVSRPFTGIPEGDKSEEFFVTPAAFTKIKAIAGDLPETIIAKGENDSVGTLLGVPCRSPVFVKPSMRNFEGLSDGQIEHRFMGSRS